MISVIFSRLIILVFGVLYPAYASYKAVRTRDVKKYVQWMMYWIVFAFFTCIETFTDIFLSWFPFYYEVKVILVIWLLSPATKGSSTLYRKFVHPMLTRRESEIDEYLSQAKEKSYSTMMELGSKGVNYATSVIMQTAIKSMTNLGSARDLMGKLSGDQPDGGRNITQKISYRVIEGDEANNHQETPRNKRSVSVDSGLFREKGGVTYEERMAQRTIPEGDENVSEPEEGRTRRSNKGGDDGGDGGKSKVKRSAKTNSGSRLRGRAGIH